MRSHLAAYKIAAKNTICSPIVGIGTILSSRHSKKCKCISSLQSISITCNYPRLRGITCTYYTKVIWIHCFCSKNPIKVANLSTGSKSIFSITNCCTGTWLNFIRTNCSCTYLICGNCTGLNFICGNCTGLNFSCGYCICTNFISSNCTGCNFGCNNSTVN